MSLKPMRIKNSHHSAFTLLEVLLSSVIFIITVVGVFATLNAVRTPVTNKEGGLSAAIFAKQVLEALYSQVSAANYYTACGASPCTNFDLSPGLHNVNHTILSNTGGGILACSSGCGESNSC